MTLSERLLLVDGRPTGFDYMRIILAVSILLWHAQSTSWGVKGAEASWDSFLRPIATIILPMFFALSGFLVAGSLERCRTLVSFLYLRVIRIVPALGVEILISALILGPLVTEMPLSEYFQHPLFWSYFQNILGIIHFQLPGVFGDNPYPNMVNGQLWTIPYELECYIAIAVIALFYGYQKSWVLTGIVGLLLTYFVYHYFTAEALPPRNLPGRALVVTFLCGIWLYRMRTWVPYSQPLAWLSFLMALAFCSVPGMSLLALAPITYLTVYLGLTNFGLPAVLKTGDYSYGIFLYHFAIQQFLVQRFPIMQTYVWNAATSLIVAAVIAFISWHLVEKHAMKLKKATKVIDGFVAKVKLRPMFQRLPFGRSAAEKL